MGQEDENGEPVNHVFDLYVDSRGILWISTSNGLVRYYADKERFVRYNNRPNSPITLSDTHTKHLAELPTGELLLATVSGLNVINVQSGTTRILKHEPGNENSLHNDRLWAVTVDKNGDVWVGSEKGVDRINWSTGKYTFYGPNRGSDSGLSHEQVLSIREDRQGDMWIGTADGLNKISAQTGKVAQFLHDPDNPKSIGANGIRRIIQDVNGILWISTDHGGLNAVDPTQMQFTQFKWMGGVNDSLNSNVVRTVFEDRTGDLWVGNFPTGINYYDRSNSAATLYTANAADPNTLSHNSVLSFASDPLGNYWIGTDGGGLNYFNRKTETFTHFVNNPKDPNSISSNAVLATYLDSENTLWIGTWAGGLNRYDPQTQKFIRYIDLAKNKGGAAQLEGLISPNVRVIQEDRLGTLWIGTQTGGLKKLDRKTGKFTHYMPDANDPSAILYDIIYSLLEDSKGRFWVGTQYSLELMDRDKETFSHFQKNDNDPTSISNNMVLSMFEDSKKRVWFGTSDGINLLLDDNKGFRHFGKKDGLYDAVIRSIVEGPDGQLWLGTNNGISSLDPDTGAIKNYYKNSGWQTGNFNVGAAKLTQKNELLFGGDNGFTFIDIAQLKPNTTVPPIVITDFKLFTDSINIDSNDGLLSQALDHTKLITLNDKQSMFSFTFSALNYKNASQNEYAYRLEGFDKEWRHVGAQRYATYTNIDPGDYVFHVIGSNNDGIWNTQGSSIHVRILPPWWRTWWAYAMYAAAAFGILSWIFLIQRYKRSLAEQQIKKLMALDKLKDDFIANTSHELRTPLNGIIGLADSLIEGAAGQVSESMSVNLKMISISGKRLANLVNDILDFAKLKNKNIRLNTQPTNLYEVTQIVLNLCAHTLKLSDLKIVNKIRHDVPTVLADSERLQQILYNLVGNAIKFTKEGSVTLEAEEKGDWLWINVVDTGIGVPAQSLDKIFNSFEQLEDHRERAYSGTGLGLAVTKQLIELHGGTIEVESHEGQGSCFRFSLPITQEKPQSSLYQTIPMDYNVSKVIDSAYENEAAEGVTTNMRSTGIALSPPSLKPNNLLDLNGTQDNSQFRILIVDDNPINQQVLINQLTLQQYQIAVANDGYSALSLVENEGPFDLILLDIMMPHMSGYEVCSRLRRHYPMEELPVIFLTAKNTISDLVSGFEVGANDFLTKPISIGELNSRVKTHLQLLTINRTLERIVANRTHQVTIAHNELRTLDQMVGMISQEIRLDRLLPVILDQVSILFPTISYIAYWKFNENNERFELLYSGADDLTPRNSISNDLDNGTLEQTIEQLTLKQLFIRHHQKIADDIYLYNQLDTNTLPGLPTTKSMLSMVFRQEERIHGVLVLGATKSGDAFAGMQPINYERLQTHIDSALSKARLVERLESKCEELEQMSLTDQLTGLQNRRFLSKYIEHDIAMLQRQYSINTQDSEFTGGRDLVFFLMDIDHFKHTNDTLGHAAGDRILANIHLVLNQVFRQSDYRIRWGGEEFLIVTRFCDRNDASIKAEQLRSAMAAFNFEIEKGIVVNKTCSIGFACYPFSSKQPDALTWAQVINVADLALYAVKRSQRNGWLGIIDNGSLVDDRRFHKIMENPDQEIDAGNIMPLTNLPIIRWP